MTEVRYSNGIAYVHLERVRIACDEEIEGRRKSGRGGQMIGLIQGIRTLALRLPVRFDTLLDDDGMTVLKRKLGLLGYHFFPRGKHAFYEEVERELVTRVPPGRADPSFIDGGPREPEK